ncbi:Cytoplasmic phosphatidylinositol transfer protein 1 [Camelus dromedarius]|uniref:Cytoplasmic phosphatidylinositol transfer protein 1 n=1 Tax=Camelus dromedarius TaxID=9838 RepID=A0A5N4D4R8_CAMDR|nr:Cytoplasmic phosphatidylinositol transfer protein 1 [Camelus dromedarius]
MPQKGEQELTTPDFSPSVICFFLPRKKLLLLLKRMLPSLQAATYPVAAYRPQYKIGQLYMISKHSHEQSDRGEGVEVVQNEPFEDPHHGNGQFTEKRVYLNR